ncbi:SGNH/GDSL hydrolase family protein [Thalassoroseus pseudoceratinae]|uniref:SGNH/GDSL hydrolase family protein n=1 Tax=Thalassoroseus pseudoceratinae TaxID=2713176 RepID=UPI001424A236|nr:SGNH/GDSL hydrolase family protein [Thalassoroseus pseudoceratinae]
MFKRLQILALILLLPTPLVASNIVRNVNLRGNFDNCRIQFEREETGHVAFIGGSITEMNGYRPMVCEFLQKQFPKTKFNFTAAGISSTCSTTGAFRLERDVLSKGPVDLFFIEFAVNDDQDAGHARRECIRGLEGIVRQVREHNPQADIVITYFVNPSMLETLQAGKTPLTISSHEAVAEHYNITTVNLAKEVAEQISADELSWKVYGGTHPKPAGNRICATMIADQLSQLWAEELSPKTTKKKHSSPSKPLDSNHYGNGRFVSPEKAEIVRDWKWGIPAWDELPGGKRSRFTNINMLSADRPGAELSLEFTGKAVGAYIVAGPDAGIVEASIDNQPFKSFDLYHHYSRGLHYPRSVIFAADLEPKEHTLRLRISEKSNEESSGHAMRIIQFEVN